MPELPPLATQVRGLSLPERLTRAIEELQQFLRVRGGLLPGENLDAYISRRDLVQWGFATSDLAAGGAPGPGTGPVVPVPVTGNEPDYTRLQRIWRWLTKQNLRVKEIDSKTRSLVLERTR